MKVKKYYVQDMKEGMLRIRRELGPEAIIVQSRKVRMKGIMGFFAPRRMEITAAVEDRMTDGRFAKEEQSSSAAALGQELEQRISSELGELRKTIEHLIRRSSLAPEHVEKEREELRRWQEHLEEQEVLQEITVELFGEIKERLDQEAQFTEEIVGLILRNKLRKKLKTAPEKGAPIQVFVGPTGVGKTTTLAKLAARYALYQGEKVGIITIDHYRIGAVEQMRTYTDITGLPLEVVMTPKELRRAIEKFNGCQRILIDTAGRSTLNIAHINELAGYIGCLPPAEIFLVVSATTKARDLKLITDNFSGMKYNRLIFTKLDETNSYGMLLNGIHLTGLPAIYLTTGQSVPDDICLADVDTMSALILGDDE